MDTPSLQKLTYLVILIVNVAFILGAIYLLWRVNDSSEKASEDLRGAAGSTQQALNDFKEWMREFKSVVLTAAPAPRSEEHQGTADSPRMLAELQKISTSIEELDARRLQQLLAELGTVIHSLADESSAGAGSDTTALYRLQGQRERLAAEVEQLQKRLDESARAIADLRRENRASFTSGSALDTLKQVNERLFTEIKNMRTRMLQAEERSAMMSNELEKLRLSKYPQESRDTGGSIAEIADLQKRLLTLESDRAQLLSQLQETEESMSRMLREKAMIEERYLELDNEQT